VSQRTDGVWKTPRVPCAGLVQLIAGSMKDKGDQIQRGQHIGQSMVSMSEVDPSPTRVDIECILDQQRVGMALICAVLYPIVVGLVLKHIWEHEQGKTVSFNHNVHSLFVQLKSETQCDVKIFYEQICRQYKSAIEKGR